MSIPLGLNFDEAARLLRAERIEYSPAVHAPPTGVGYLGRGGRLEKQEVTGESLELCTRYCVLVINRSRSIWVQKATRN